MMKYEFSLMDGLFPCIPVSSNDFIAPLSLVAIFFCLLFWFIAWVLPLSELLLIKLFTCFQVWLTLEVWNYTISRKLNHAKVFKKSSLACFNSTKLESLELNSHKHYLRYKIEIIRYIHQLDMSVLVEHEVCKTFSTTNLFPWILMKSQDWLVWRTPMPSCTWHKNFYPLFVPGSESFQGGGITGGKP